MKYFVAACLAVASLWPAMSQAKVIATVVVKQPDAPVQIARCIGFTGGQSQAAVAFYNATRAKTVDQVAFKFDTLDTDNRSLGSGTFVRAGKFSPHVMIDPPKEWDLGVPQAQYAWRPGALGWYRIQCAVTQVKFSDGSIWSAPTDEVHPWNPLDDISPWGHQ